MTNPEMVEIIKAIEKGSGRATTDVIGVVYCLLHMSPNAKMAFADMLNGSILFEEEKWRETHLNIDLI